MERLNYDQLESMINFCNDKIISNLEYPKNEFDAIIIVSVNTAYKEIIQECETRKRLMNKGVV